MADIGVGESLITPTPVDPWPGCGVPPVLFGTGDLFIVDNDTGLEVNAGNFTAVNLSEDADTFRFFPVGSDSVSAGATTAAWRLSLVSDFFSFQNLARILNADRTGIVGGEVAHHETVRELELFNVIFRRDLTIDDPCDAQTCTTLEVEFWRGYFDVGTGWAMAIASAFNLNFNLVILPDLINHPSAPFGSHRIICPVEQAS